MDPLQIAEQIARAAHAGQTEESTGDDYIKHVERVVGFVEGDDAKAVAWLHDVIEDTPLTFVDLLKAGLPSRIIGAVVWLTHYPAHTYAQYIQLVKDSGDELAIAVKIADLRDHLRPNCPKRLRPRYEKAWQELVGSAFAATASDSSSQE